MLKTSAEVDLDKNRIYLRFEGFMTVTGAQRLRDDYRQAIEKCRPGFTVLTYAVDYKPGTPEVQEIVASMAKIAEVAGCSKVARVVGDKPLGSMQIDRIAKSVTKYPSRHFQSVEEAEEYLDE
jgi:hypothetical protein